MQTKRLTAAELAALFGTTEAALTPIVGPLLDQAPLDYRELSEAEQAATRQSVRDVIEAGQLRASGTHRHGDWEDGWLENLRDFEASNYDPDALLPKYYRKLRPNRMRGTFVQGDSPLFMYAVSALFQRWLYATYFADCRSLHEFGCGTGHNLWLLGTLFPDKPLYGYDWARSSQQILALIGEKLGLDIHGSAFDFFNPPQALNLGEQAGVLTFGALEQVGDRHGPFLDALLRAGPKLCVHVEGFLELYDPDASFDVPAIAYHKARNYLDGYLTRLYELADQGRIEILAVHRQHFGNLFDDPYSHVVWRPK